MQNQECGMREKGEGCKLARDIGVRVRIRVRDQ